MPLRRRGSNSTGSAVASQADSGAGADRLLAAAGSARAQMRRAGMLSGDVAGRRVFVALPVAADAAAAIRAWAEASLTGSLLRLTTPTSYHVTLVFCGFVEESRIPDLVAIVAGSMPARLAWRLEPEAIRVLGGVVALVCRHTGADQLQQSLAARLAAAGFSRPQRRAWLAHITIARSRTTRPSLRGGLVAPPLVLRGDRVVVYESRPGRTGARYEPLASLPQAPAS